MEGEEEDRRYSTDSDEADAAAAGVAAEPLTLSVDPRESARSTSPAPGSASPPSPTVPGSFKSKLAKQAKRFKEEAAAKQKATTKHQASFTEVIEANEEAVSTSQEAAVRLAQRNIRTDPAVRRIATTIWTSAPPNPDSGKFDGDCFVQLAIRIQQITRAPPWDLAEVFAASQESWRRLCPADQAHIGEQEFVRYLFDVTDSWTQSGLAAEYKSVLSHLLQGLTAAPKTRGASERPWKQKTDVAFDEFFGSRDRLTIRRMNEVVPRLNYLTSSLSQYLNDKRLRGKSKEERRGNLTPEKVCTQIAKLYQARMAAEVRGFSNKNTVLDPTNTAKAELRFDTFITGFYERKYGSSKESRSHMSAFANAVHQFASMANGLEHPRITMFARLVGIPLAGGDADNFFHPIMLRQSMLPALQRLFPSSDGLEGSADLVAALGDGSETIVAKPKDVLKAALPTKSLSSSMPAELKAKCSAEAKKHMKGGFDMALLQYMPLWRLLSIQYNIRLRKGASAMRNMIATRRRRQLMESGIDSGQMSKLAALSGKSSQGREGEAAVRLAQGGDSGERGGQRRGYVGRGRRTGHTIMAARATSSTPNAPSSGAERDRRAEEATRVDGKARATSDLKVLAREDLLAVGGLLEDGEENEEGEEGDENEEGARGRDERPSGVYYCEGEVADDSRATQTEEPLPDIMDLLGSDGEVLGWSVDTTVQGQNSREVVENGEQVVNRAREEKVVAPRPTVTHAEAAHAPASDNGVPITYATLKTYDPPQAEQAAKADDRNGELVARHAEFVRFEAVERPVAVVGIACPEFVAGALSGQIASDAEELVREGEELRDRQTSLQGLLDSITELYNAPAPQLQTDNAIVIDSTATATTGVSPVGKMAGRLREEVTDTRQHWTNEMNYSDDIFMRCANWRRQDDLCDGGSTIGGTASDVDDHATPIEEGDAGSESRVVPAIDEDAKVPDLIARAKQLHSDLRAGSQRIITSKVGPY